MRTVLTVLLLVTLLPGMTAAAAAYDLGNQAPAKSPGSYPENIPNPERQGGDTIASAYVIPSLPYTDSGTTAGYNNDYDAVCPNPGSTAPDVVYKYVAGVTGTWNIDLCGSAYDTKLYVYDVASNLIACNDDFYSGDPCGTYVSKVENVTVAAGGIYYIIIDGYGGACGDYELEVTPYLPCELQCQPDWWVTTEGEPPLVNDYVDNHNGGCNTPPNYPLQTVGLGDGQGNVTLCGVSGWYLVGGSQYRDTDWFLLYSGAFLDGIEITIMAERPTFIFELGPQDCTNVGVIQQAETQGECVAPAFMTITGYDLFDPVWFWVGPTVFAPPVGAGNEYDYVCWFSGLQPVANQPTSWSTVKALFE